MLTRIQILRAFAAYAVVFFHCGEMIGGNGGSTIPGHYIGSAGVDVFFVMSGFVMVYIAADRAGPGRFMFDRIARIVPLYWIATLAVIIAVSIRPWLFLKALATPETNALSLLFIPHPDATGHLAPILEVGWTLNFEMMFYALFALSMFAASAWRIPVVLGLIALLFIGGSLAPDGWIFSFYGDPILFEFAAGCIIGWLVSSETRLSFISRVPGWIYILAGIGVLGFNELVVDLSGNRLLRWGIPAMLVVLGVIVLDLTKPKTARGLLVSLGDSSYSAYLLHVFIVNAVSFTVLRLVGTSFGGAVVIYATVFILTAVISAFSYKLIEIPSRDFLRRCFLYKRAKDVAENT